MGNSNFSQASPKFSKTIIWETEAKFRFNTDESETNPQHPPLDILYFRRWTSQMGEYTVIKICAKILLTIYSSSKI